MLQKNKIFLDNLNNIFSSNKLFSYSLIKGLKNRVKIEKSKSKFKIKSKNIQLREKVKPKTLRKNLFEFKLNKNLEIEKNLNQLNFIHNKAKLNVNLKEIFSETSIQIFCTLKKELFLLHFFKRRQFIYFLEEFCKTLYQIQKILFVQNTKIKFNLSNLINKIKIYNNYLTNIYYKINIFFSNNLKNILYTCFLFKTNFILLNIVFLFIIKNVKPTFYLNFSKILSKKMINNFNNGYILNNFKWNSNKFLFKYTNIIQFNKNILKNILKNKKIKNTFLNKNIKLNNVSLYFWTYSKKYYNFKNYIWKRNINYSKNISLNRNITKKDFLTNKSNINISSSKQIIYLYKIIEEKLNTYKDNKLNTLLLNFYNLLIYYLIKKKKNIKQKSLIFTTKEYIEKIKKKYWRLKIINILLKNLNKDNLLLKENLAIIKLLHNLKINKKLQKIYKKTFTKNQKVKNIHNKTKFSTKIFIKNKFKLKSWQKKKVKIKKTFIGKKLIVNEKYINFSQTKKILSTILGYKINLFFINALSLTKFAFKLERRKKRRKRRNPTKFLKVLDRDMINKYKYIAIYIKDLIRISFIALFLKKPSFIAKFIAFQIAKLPKNRKETTFIRFIIRAIKMLSSERKEILALRIKFKGRVNRWRRTKAILGQRGIFPMNTINERIEYGTAQAINKKGAIGIRIWIRYAPYFGLLLEDHFVKYFKYSEILQNRNKNILTLKN